MKLKWHPWHWESSWMSLESGWPECCTRHLFFPVPSDSSYFKTFLGLELWSEDNISLIVLWWGLKIISVKPGPQEVLSEWKRSWKGKGHRLKKIFFFSDAPSAHKYSSFPSQMVKTVLPRLFAVRSGHVTDSGQQNEQKEHVSPVSTLSCSFSICHDN